MTISQLPLSYCTNLHPGRSIEEVDDGLTRFTSAVQDSLGQPIAAGLWLARPVVEKLLRTPGTLLQFRDRLRGRGLVCYTLNAFPYGDFHRERVKQDVYRPDWTDGRRLQYTLDCAQMLAELLPEGWDGSLSTVPLAFAPEADAATFRQSAEQLLQAAVRLRQLFEQTGRRIRLAIEPEPFCLLERTEQVLDFFEQTLRPHAAEADQLETVADYVGLCFDVCHQAVEFEEVDRAIAELDRAGIRINKVHITCALRLTEPGRRDEARRALAEYVEPRYLHQTTARLPNGQILRAVDLTEDLVLRPAPRWREATEWRVHFHVPVDAEHLGPLETTRPDLQQALAAVARLNYAPHLEVETYTWSVLPVESSDELVRGLTREMQATLAMLDRLPADDPSP